MRPGDAARLRELARVFLTLGTVAFGGPAAHVALMEDEVVRRRGWLSRERFLDLVGATNLIPGPNSTELAIHLGRERAGWVGLLVAGACFIVPAMAIVWAVAWAYVRWGRLPAAQALLYGVQPVVIAVVAQALWRLARTAVGSPALLALGVAAAAAAALGADELLVLLAAALAALAWRRVAPRTTDGAGAAVLAAPLLAQGAGASLPTAGALFLVFAKIGSVLFGSGYVLLAFLRSELVERRGWLTEAQLLDAVAVGQVTPGPVFTTATFVGYVVAGHAGALAATAGIFLPAFLFVALTAPLVERLRASPTLGALLDGVNVGSLALMAVVSWHLARAALVDLPTILLAAASAVLLLRWKVNSAWLVLGGGVVGVGAYLVRG